MNPQKISKFIFWPLEIAVVMLIIVNGFLIFGRQYYLDFFYQEKLYSYGMILGLISFAFFAIALTPGILGRFGFKHKIITWILTYRREFGKLMFLFAFAHYLTIKLFPMVALSKPLTFPFFQILGFIALCIATLLFITSNNFAQRKLGKWWKVLHRFVYLMVWLIFFHVALVQGFTVVSALVFLLAFLEIMSLANFYLILLNLDE